MPRLTEKTRERIGEWLFFAWFAAILASGARAVEVLFRLPVLPAAVWFVVGFGGWTLQAVNPRRVDQSARFFWIFVWPPTIGALFLGPLLRYPVSLATPSDRAAGMAGLVASVVGFVANVFWPLSRESDDRPAGHD